MSEGKRIERSEIEGGERAGSQGTGQDGMEWPKAAGARRGAVCGSET
jgi:hypothetical protein